MRKGSSTYVGLAVILALVIGIFTSALGQSVTRTVVITRAAKLGGQAITPGKYTMVFDEKKDGEITVSKDGKEIVKTSYKRLELDKAPTENAVAFAAAADGALSVRRVEIKGLKTALQFE